jgi:hypothetical protein
MKTILIFSDAHVNSCVGLSPRTVTLDDGGTYLSSPGQSWIWDNWQALIERAAELRKTREIVLVSNGDLCEGDKHDRSYQIITKNPSTIVKMTTEAIAPLVQIASGVFFVRGTAAHVGKSGNLEDLTADGFDSTVRPETNGAASWFYLPLEVEGVRFDIAHHATMGGLPWTRAGNVSRYASRIFYEYSATGRAIPHLVVRSHMHRWGDSYDAAPCRVLFTPAWTLASEFINKIAPGALAEIGAVFIHCEDGKYEVEKFEIKPQRRVWVVA